MSSYRPYSAIVGAWLFIALLWGQVHAQFPTPSAGQADAELACAETQGRIVRESYYSALLGQNMFYSMYLPPCYAPDKVYPALFLLHGSNEDDGHWVRLGLPEALDAGISSGKYPPMLAVLPFGNLIANRNIFTGYGWNDIFMQELLPDVQTRYRLSADPRWRAIGGISRGGFWAYQIGLRYPEQFGVIGGHSAFFDARHADPADNPLDIADRSEAIFNQRLWLDSGGQDYAKPNVELMVQRLTARGVPFTYQAYADGQHANSHWRRYVGEYVDFYTAGWQANPIDTPVTAVAMTDAPIPSATPAPRLNIFATNTPMSLSNPMLELSPTPAPNASLLTGQAGQTGQTWRVFVPVVAFPALHTSLSAESLAALKTGVYDARLILSQTSAQALRELGVPLAEQTRLVADAELVQALWANRDAYSLVTLDTLTPRLRPVWVDDVPIWANIADYPFAFASAQDDLSRLTRLTASGVTALTRNTRESLNERGVAWAASGIADYVRSSDFFHISNEVSFAPDCPNLANPNLLGGTSAMCSLLEHFELLNLLDVDIVELSGNHNNDYGYAPYAETLAWYQQAGMRTVGGGATLADAQASLSLEHGTSSIAWIACNAAGPYYALANEQAARAGGVRGGAADCSDSLWLQAALAEARQNADVVILSLQQIEVEDYLPLEEQTRQFRTYADWGADVVLGTAAHKPQTYEFYTARDGRQAFIHYGMGNLFFDQPFWGNMRGFLNTLYVVDGRLAGVEIFPYLIEDNARPRLMTQEERQNFLFFMFRQQNGF